MSTAGRDPSSIRKAADPSELFVFGYSCKLFRDDEKALHIDQGKHLIPWMGDDNIKIDRYDARGTVYDLRNIEIPIDGFGSFHSLSEAEKRVEMLCNEERYRALKTNEEEESLYQEEELKRLEATFHENTTSRYKEVDYTYSAKTEPVIAGEPSEKSDDASTEKIFTPSPLLDIPVNMTLPKSAKQNAVIEKTAMFICSQGPQMEVLLKMKQSNNPLFKFLSFDDALHPYYRLIVQNIKAGRYRSVHEVTSDEDQDEDSYLHPSLAPSYVKANPTVPSVPSVTYKPSENCSYSLLVRRLSQKAKTVINENQEDLSEQSMDCDEDTIPQNENQDCQSSNSDSSRNASPIPNACEEPPMNMRLIIDKMASYVAKNGHDFENIVRTKNDGRFDFLRPSHIYHEYYKEKLKQYVPSDNDVDNDSETKNEMKPKITPVSFSIKTKEAEPVIDRSAFPCESSTEDEDPPENSSTKKQPSSTSKRKNSNNTRKEKRSARKTEIDKKEEIPLHSTEKNGRDRNHHKSNQRNSQIEVENETTIENITIINETPFHVAKLENLDEKCRVSPPKEVKRAVVKKEIINMFSDDTTDEEFFSDLNVTNSTLVANTSATLQQERKRRAREFLRKVKDKFEDSPFLLSPGNSEQANDTNVVSIAEPVNGADLCIPLNIGRPPDNEPDVLIIEKDSDASSDSSRSNSHPTKRHKRRKEHKKTKRKRKKSHKRHLSSKRHKKRRHKSTSDSTYDS